MLNREAYDKKKNLKSQTIVFSSVSEYIQVNFKNDANTFSP